MPGRPRRLRGQCIEPGVAGAGTENLPCFSCPESKVPSGRSLGGNKAAGEQTDTGRALRVGARCPGMPSAALVELLFFPVGPSLVFVFTRKSIFLMEVAPREDFLPYEEI